MPPKKIADFYYSTKTDVYGPWLIDSNQLADLDKTIDDVWKQLSGYREEYIQREVKDKLKRRLQRETDRQLTKEEAASVEAEVLDDVRQSYPNREFSREITLFLHGNKKLKVDSFKDASTHAGVADVEAFGFIVELECRDVEVQLVFDGSYRKVTLQVSPEQLPISRDVFGSIKNWIDNNQPSKWQQNWGRLSASLWFIWLFGFVLGSLVYATLSKSNPSKAEIEAREILQQGVSATNQFKAIETLLTLQLRPAGGSKTISITNWWIAACALGFCACLVFSLQPDGHLGIGKGVTTVKRWKAWIRFITIAVPGFVFSSFISPNLVDAVQRVFK